MKNVIEVENLVKRYKKAESPAVDGISFKVRRGEFFALLGPNGAGKTTVISILSTTLSKTSGRVEIAGLELDQEASEIRRRLGIIFQAPSLDMNLSAEENIRFHAALYGLYPYRPFYSFMSPEYRKQVQFLSEVLGIEGDLHKAVGSFSGGMKRKLEIVRSLMHKPEVLILDEPTTGLDPISRKNLWDYLREVRKTHNTTILLTTHYLEEAEEADSVYIINRGNIVANGSPASLKRKLTREYMEVETKQVKKMAAELNQRKIAYTKDGKRFQIPLEDNDAVQLIKSIQTPISNLRFHTPTLEEAYFSTIES